MLLKGLQDDLGKIHDLAELKHSLHKQHRQYRLGVRYLCARSGAQLKRLLRAYDDQRVALLQLWDTAPAEP